MTTGDMVYRPYIAAFIGGKWKNLCASVSLWQFFFDAIAPTDRRASSHFAQRLCYTQAL